MGFTQTTLSGHIRQEYQNSHGIGFFYPEHRARVSGISRVYGLAYIDEGWLETERGTDKVEIIIGDKIYLARLYVKNRYFVRTYDTTDFDDGELQITARAWDKSGNLIGCVSQMVFIDNANAAEQKRVFAAPNGEISGDGSINSPWDIETALTKMERGNILFLRGGVYEKQMIMNKSGFDNMPSVVMNYESETVNLNGFGLEIKEGTSYFILSGIDQSGTTHDNFGLHVYENIEHVSVWDCSFCDNTHPYASLPYQNLTEYGTGLYAGGILNKSDQSRARRYFEVSHCLSSGNDVDGYHLASTVHGRFQFLEACWTPDSRNPEKRADIFQFRHANGFAADNSEYLWNCCVSNDIAYLFCYSHHNGQDGWDIRSPHTRLFGCVTHDEAEAGKYSGRPFGGVGFKFWEYDYHFANCLSFRNNITDYTGDGLVIACDGVLEPRFESYRRKNALIHNTAFYNTANHAIAFGANSSEIHIKNCVIQKAKRVLTDDITGQREGYISHCILWDIATSVFDGGDKNLPVGFTKSQIAEPGFTDPEQGNFFPKENSIMLVSGNTAGMPFDVDGVDYSVLDGLGRPRGSCTESGPYTRYDG